MTGRRTHPWLPLAARALHEAGRRDLPAASATVRQLQAEHGPDAIPEAMIAWIDTALHAAGIDEYGQPRQLAFFNLSTGEATTNSNDLRPEVAWAARLINARAADDEPAFRALIDSATTSDATWGRHVMELLVVCALSARAASASKS